MEIFDKISMKTKHLFNVCRCCLSRDGIKNITAECYSSGQREVYEDMLRDTFNLQISHLQTPSLICEECGTRLRDAHSFKQMVERNEKELANCSLVEDVDTDINPEKSSIETLVIKFEDTHDDGINEQDDEQVIDDASFDDDDEILANLKIEMTRSAQAQSTAKRRNRESEDRNVRKRCKTKENNSTGKPKKHLKHEKDWLKITERRGNGPLLRENSLKLLVNSTICVFQWYKSRYRCFCCNEPFSDVNMLRQHTNITHTIENIEKKIILQQNRLVKAEISFLFCKICDSPVDGLNNLRSHLRNHGIQFELDDDLLVPFKIDSGNLQCQLCEQTFNKFRFLNIHMNKHYQKQVCHICGAGFSNLVFLNLHKSRSHRPLSCKECSLDFANKIEKRHHDVNVHNLKIERKLRFPCPYCNERYFQENLRVQHLVDKHGMKKPEYKCSMCSKVYITKSLCNNHMKTVHMKEKNHECDVCHNLFYTRSDVNRHRVTHTGEKNYSCAVCNNVFATRDSLRRHMRRTHAVFN